MLRKMVRIGAIASVAFSVAILSGTVGTAADAQESSVEDTVLAVEETAVPEPAIRFVSREVVQPLPETDVSEEEALRQPQAAASLHELVRDTPVDDRFSPELRCLAQGVYFESRGESLPGQLAVAQVIVNRAASGRYPDDYCSVITQRAQFSFVRGGRIPEPNTGSAAWQRAKAIARIAHRELWDSEAEDSLYFHATYVKPRWARHKIARATIDRHIFYR